MFLLNYIITYNMLRTQREVFILSVIFLSSVTLQAGDLVYPVPVTLAKNTQLTELAYIGKEYSVSFELFINKFGTDTYQSVLHLSTGGNLDEMGNRNPAVFVYNTSPVQLHITSAVSGNKNMAKNFPGLVENKWQKIEISQKLVDGKVVTQDLILEL